MSKIYTCDYCGSRLGDLACGNKFDGSFCSGQCADIAEKREEYERAIAKEFGESPVSIEDMLANLASKVAELQREVNELRAVKANREEIEKFAETATQADLAAKKAAEDILALAYDVDALKWRDMQSGRCRE